LHYSVRAEKNLRRQIAELHRQQRESEVASQARIRELETQNLSMEKQLAFWAVEDSPANPRAIVGSPSSLAASPSLAETPHARTRLAESSSNNSNNNNNNNNNSMELSPASPLHASGAAIDASPHTSPRFRVSFRSQTIDVAAAALYKKLNEHNTVLVIVSYGFKDAINRGECVRDRFIRL
jgi:hypothetical protein